MKCKTGKSDEKNKWGKQIESMYIFGKSFFTLHIQPSPKVWTEDHLDFIRSCVINDTDAQEEFVHTQGKCWKPNFCGLLLFFYRKRVPQDGRGININGIFPSLSSKESIILWSEFLLQWAPCMWSPSVWAHLNPNLISVPSTDIRPSQHSFYVPLLIVGSNLK